MTFSFLDIEFNSNIMNKIEKKFLLKKLFKLIILFINNKKYKILS